MIAPASNEERAEIVGGEAIRFIRDDPRRSFPRPRDHWQRAGNLAVPRGEGMRPAAAVAEAVAVIAPFDDVQQPAGGAAVGIVVDGEEPPEGIDAARMRIPEAGCPPLQLRPIGPTAIDVSPFATAGKRHAIAADDFVIGTQNSAQAEVHPAERIERESRETVVRVVACRFKMDDPRPFVGLQVAVGIAEHDNLATRGNENGEWLMAQG